MCHRSTLLLVMTIETTVSHLIQSIGHRHCLRRRGHNRSFPETCRAAFPVPRRYRCGFRDVEDQDRAQFVAVVPRLMLDRVIENKGTPLLPLTRLAAHAKSAPVRHDKGQMDDRAYVGDARVGRNMRARTKQRKENARRTPRNIRHGQGLQQGSGLRTARAGVVLPHPVLPQELGAPCRRIVQGAPLVRRRPGFLANIGLQSVTAGFEQRQKFAANDIRLRFQPLKPRK